MNKDKQPFTPESVDNEIDQLINSHSSISSKARIMHELRHVCKENADSLERVRERLERYSMRQPSSHTSQEHTSQGSREGTLQRQLEGNHIIALKKSSRNGKYPASQLFTVLVATITGLFLVGSLAWILGIIHLAIPGAARLSSSVGSVTPTAQAANTAPTQSNGLSQPMIAIRMLDTMHGWVLTSHSILKTADGGIDWQDVTPANAFSHATPTSISKGDFLSDRDAWVILPPQRPLNAISVLRTTDGGESWQSSTIPATAGVTTDMPHFLNPSDGWLQTFGQPASGASAIFHTTDGGQHWNEVALAKQRAFISLPGVSIINAQNDWKASDNAATTMSVTTNNVPPLLEVTHDGGQTWHSQLLSVLRISRFDRVSITPPVFFGNNGLLPVMDQMVPPPHSKSSTNIRLELYVTHNGGQTWAPTPTRLVTSNDSHMFTVDVVDMQHAWAVIGTDLYATSDSGQNWTKLPPTPQPLGELSFIDVNNGWAIGPSNATAPSPELLHTIDGGHTWQQINYTIQ